MDGVNGLELDKYMAPLLQLDVGQISISLLLSLALGLTIAVVYRISVPGRILSPALQSSLILLAMVAAMVMMVIGNNLARAFSLVGALAIVRFRTRLRSPWDISFIFFALAAGIGCGVFAYRVAVLGTLFVGLAVLGLYVLPLSGIRKDRIRNLRFDVASFEGVEARLTEVLERYVKRKWLLESRSLRFGESLSFRYRVALRDTDQTARMMRDLSGIEGVERVVLDAGEEASEEE
jgi:hypothetical protein